MIDSIPIAKYMCPICEEVSERFAFKGGALGTVRFDELGNPVPDMVVKIIDSFWEYTCMKCARKVNVKDLVKC
jgi:hypothetical protein